MKRYWKIILLCFVMVIVIGTFYIQSSLAAKESVKIEFKKLSGNEDEVKNIILYADYRVDNQYQYLQITDRETIDLYNLSLLQRLTTNTISPVFKELIEQYRNFMRGKDLMDSYFYEDENLLVYAGIKEKDFTVNKDFTFDIDVLNKKSEESTPIQLDVKRENYNWIDVVEVQVIDGKLKIITIGFGADGGKDLKVYTIDIEEKKLVSDQTILSAPTVENGWTNLTIINDFYSTQPTKYLLIEKEAYEEKQIQGDGEMVTDGKSNFIIYDVENNQSEKLFMPDVMSEIIGTATIIDSTIFIPFYSEGGFELYQYDIDKGEWGRTFNLPDTNSEKDFPYLKLMNGRIYLVGSTNNEFTIFIGNLKTGESLYEGKLEVKNYTEDQKNTSLYISNIEFIQ